MNKGNECILNDENYTFIHCYGSVNDGFMCSLAVWMNICSEFSWKGPCRQQGHLGVLWDEGGTNTWQGCTCCSAGRTICGFMSKLPNVFNKHQKFTWHRFGEEPQVLCCDLALSVHDTRRHILWNQRSHLPGLRVEILKSNPHPTPPPTEGWENTAGVKSHMRTQAKDFSEITVTLNWREQSLNVLFTFLQHIGAKPATL